MAFQASGPQGQIFTVNLAAQGPAQATLQAQPIINQQLVSPGLLQLLGGTGGRVMGSNGQIATYPQAIAPSVDPQAGSFALAQGAKGVNLGQARSHLHLPAARCCCGALA